VFVAKARRLILRLIYTRDVGLVFSLNDAISIGKLPLALAVTPTNM
jgi:hypothetical protein